MLLKTQSQTGMPRGKCGTAQPSFGMDLNGKSGSHYLTNTEPSLDDVMRDDIVRQVMHCDGVEPDQLMTLVQSLRRALS